ncbi:hypothetical protein PIB30_079625 [Stylosanthes scabra]|uniref:Uncharacterized protein n=1 Tax=Stylosanthes scabra TaxID=79078 RepID=A0ABU6QRC1_9FABA|nr:hypothetical protein [Stylosanthes scabra]
MGDFCVKVHHGGRFRLVAGAVTGYVDGVPLDDFDYDIGYIDVGAGSNAAGDGFVNVEVGLGYAGEAQEDGWLVMCLTKKGKKVVNEDEAADNEEDSDYEPESDYSADSDLNFNDSEDDYCRDDPLFDVDITLNEL